MNEPSLYHYKAIVTGIYDGDTITLTIDLGLNTWLHDQKIRLYGIDTPEIRGPEREQGLIVRKAVLDRMPVGTEVLVETIKDRTGKFGRWLGIIWLPGSEISINDWLLETGRAQPYLES